MRMPTNLAIDDELLDEALKLSGRRRRRGFARLFGSVDFRPDWDYKAARRRG